MDTSNTAKNTGWATKVYADLLFAQSSVVYSTAYFTCPPKEKKKKKYAVTLYKIQAMCKND